jgi:hypothetical protein
MSTTDTTAAPLEVLQQAAGAATAVAAAVTTSAIAKPPGMEELLEIYNKNFWWNVIYLVVLTIIQIVVLFNVFIGGSFADIIKNWPKHRCNPMIMPFAALFGYDANENFNFCMKNIFNVNAAAVLGPVYTLMSKFTDIAATIANSANSFRYLIANLLNGMERLMNSYRDRFQFLIFTIRMSYMKMMTLMGRLYGAFYAVIFMGLSGLKAADNVANNDLVKFLLEFCFDPDTPIELADGSVKKLSEVKIGDVLKTVDDKKPIVTSVFLFNGTKTPMVRIGKTLVSKEHFTFHNDTWIKAGDHPDAVAADSIPELVCLNTDTHVFELNGTIFADYDESDDASVVQTTQALAEMRLNAGVFDEMNEKTSAYELGLDGSMLVVYKDGSSNALMDVKIGDELLGGGVVMGLVQEKCGWVCKLPNGLLVSASQLLWDKDFSLWRRAAFVYPDSCFLLDKPAVLYQLTVSNNIIESIDTMFRDYREVNDPDMEMAYENDLSKKLNKGLTNLII